MRTDRVSKVLFLNLFLFINCISRSDCSDLLLTPLLEFLLSSQYLLGVLTPSRVRLRIKLLYDLLPFNNHPRECTHPAVRYSNLTVLNFSSHRYISVVLLRVHLQYNNEIGFPSVLL